MKFFNVSNPNFSVTRKWLEIVLFLLGISISGLTSGCSQDGENPYVLWQQYAHPEGAFTFYYMAPPFNVSPDSTDTRPVVVVHEYSEPYTDGLDARVRVEAWVATQSREDEMLHRIDYWLAKGYVKERNIRYFNYFGDEGAMIEFSLEDHWAKELFFDYGNNCVAISAWTDEQGTKEDIEFLLAGFQPGEVQE